MDIGEREGVGCGIGERIILPDSGRGMREGIGEEVNSISFEDREISRIRRSIVQSHANLCRELWFTFHTNAPRHMDVRYRSLLYLPSYLNLEVLGKEPSKSFINILKLFQILLIPQISSSSSPPMVSSHQHIHYKV